MPVKTRAQTLSGIFFLFSSINLFFLQRRLYLLAPLALAEKWAGFLFALGVVSFWEPVVTSRGGGRLKFFLRYKYQAPLGFFYWYPTSLKRGQLLSLRALRQSSSLRPGVTFLLATPRGLLTSLECLRSGLGGVLVGLLV